MSRSGVHRRDEQRAVLFVDDDDDTRFAYEVSVASAEIRVELASNGLEGLAKARLLHLDAVVVEARLPDMDGLELIQRLRAGPRTRTLPILVLTSIPRDQIAALLVDIPLCSYLEKPCLLEDLLGRLDELFEANPRVAPPLMQGKQAKK